MIHIFSQNFTDTQVTITGDDYNHLRNVLRVQPGEEILVSDGSGTDYIAGIAEICDGYILADIRNKRMAEAELPCSIVLYQCLPKSDKMELITQKCVELGVSRIVPVESSRCVVKLDEKNRHKKVERWQKIADSASEQCLRSRIPEVSDVMRWKDALQDAQKLDRSVIAYEHKNGAEDLKQLLEDARERRIDSLGIIIGPEGGFSEEEVAQATEKGIIPITLGHRILRTETAGLALISAVMLEIEAGGAL